MIELHPDADLLQEVLATLGQNPVPLVLLRRDFCLSTVESVRDVLAKLQNAGHNLEFVSVKRGEKHSAAVKIKRDSIRMAEAESMNYWRKRYEYQVA